MLNFVNPHMTTLSVQDLIDEPTVACLAGQFNELGRYLVPRGVGLSVGWGLAAGQDSAEGRVYADIRDDEATPEAEDGLLRLVIVNPQDRVELTLWESRTERLRTSASDPRQMLPLPRIPVKIGPDHAVVLMFRPDADDTVVAANSELLLDCTLYDAVYARR